MSIFNWYVLSLNVYQWICIQLRFYNKFSVLFSFQTIQIQWEKTHYEKFNRFQLPFGPFNFEFEMLKIPNKNHQFSILLPHKYERNLIFVFFLFWMQIKNGKLIFWWLLFGVFSFNVLCVVIYTSIPLHLYLELGELVLSWP